MGIFKQQEKHPTKIMIIDIGRDSLGFQEVLLEEVNRRAIADANTNPFSCAKDATFRVNEVEHIQRQMRIGRKWNSRRAAPPEAEPYYRKFSKLKLKAGWVK